MSRPFLLGLAISLGLTILATVHATRSQQPSPAERAEDSLETKRATATRVDLSHGGALRAERSKSSILRPYIEFQHASTLEQSMKNSAGTAVSILVNRPDDLIAEDEPKTSEELIRYLSKRSSLVLRGKVVGHLSDVTSDHKFIFTDYQVQVSSVLKDRTGRAINVGDQITVTMPGGRVMIDNFLVEAVDASYGSQLAEGDYLFFLKIAEGEPTFGPAAPDSTFLVMASGVVPITQLELPPSELENIRFEKVVSVLQELQNSNQ